MSVNLEKEKRIVSNVMQKAGVLALMLRKAALDISYKSNQDLLTNADIEINTLLQTEICEAFPEDGWLSEETADDASRLRKQRVWIVDPLDGTKEYARGLPEFAISVALVEGGLPIFSCVYNPAQEALCYALQGQGVWLNHQRVVRPVQSVALGLVSCSEWDKGEWSQHQGVTLQPMGSIAYRLMQVALGKASFTLSFAGRSDWDIAAGVHLVQEAGGLVTTLDNEAIVFNTASTRKPSILASYSRELHEDLLRSYRRA